MSASDGGSTAGLAADTGLAAELARLRADLAALVDAGAADRIPDDAVDALLTVGVKLYAVAQQGADVPLSAFGARAVAPADAIRVVNHLLRAANVDPFELALWHSWGKP